jgi:hypothetical protein
MRSTEASGRARRALRFSEWRILFTSSCGKCNEELGYGIRGEGYGQKLKAEFSRAFEEQPAEAGVGEYRMGAETGVCGVG